MVQAQAPIAPASEVTIRQLELSAFLARVYGPAHDFDAAVLGVTGDVGLAYLGPLAALAGLTAAGRSRGGAAVVRRLDAGGRSLSRARAPGHEPPGARGHDGSARRAAHGARLVGGAVSGVFRAAAPVRLDFAGGWTDVPPFSAREGGVVVVCRDRALRARRGACPAAAASGWSPRISAPASSCPTRRALVPAGRWPCCRRACACCPSGPCALHHPVRGAAGLRARQLGRARRRAGGARSPRPAASPLDAREIADLACRLEAVEAGIPGGRQDQFTAAFGGFLVLGFRDPDADRRAARARSRRSRRARAADGAGATPAPHASRAPPSAGSCRPTSAATARSPARCTGCATSPSGWPTRCARATSPAIGALLDANWRQQQDARPRHVHAADGAARDAHALAPARSAARRRARAPAAACSSSRPDDPAPAVAAARAHGHDGPAGAVGRPRECGRADRAGARRPPRAARRRRPTWRRSRGGSPSAPRPLLAAAARRAGGEGAALGRRRHLPRRRRGARVRPLEPRRRTAAPAAAERFTGERHDRAWARFQHLWLAERAADARGARGARRATRARRGGPARSWRDYGSPLLRVSQPGQRARARAGCSSRPISSRSGSPNYLAAATLLRESGAAGRATWRTG